MREGLEDVSSMVNYILWVLEFQCLCNLGVGFACGIPKVI